MPGHHDDRKLAIAGRKTFLNFDAAHFRHAHVDQQAARPSGCGRAEEIQRRCEGFDREAGGFHQDLKRIAYGVVIVQDEDGRLPIVLSRCRHHDSRDGRFRP